MLSQVSDHGQAPPMRVDESTKYQSTYTAIQWHKLLTRNTSYPILSLESSCQWSDPKTIWPTWFASRGAPC